jgi:glucosyl-dolichyl phosphate glucuronosyltransferase
VKPELSIVVCTRNRARPLVRCLDSLARLEGSAALEAVVVDNASEDGTASTVAEIARRIPWLRYVAEPTVGLSRARNCGLSVVAADVVAFVDDDAEVESGWGEALRRAFVETRAAVVGGPILPRFEGLPPANVTPTHLGAWSCQDHGSERRLIREFPYLFGANLAARRDHLKRLGGFDERFGRSGRSLLSGEDTDLCERTLAAGGELLYEPQAVVHHWIPPDRVSSGYLRRRALATGRTRALQMTRRLRRADLVGALAAKAMKLPAHAFLWGVAAATGRRETAVERSWSVFATVGTLAHFLTGKAWAS